jgi:hypothetical protein
VVAPPSEAHGCHYEFIQGSLDDLDRLPVIRNLDAHLYKTPAPKQDPEHRQPAARFARARRPNAALFNAIGPVARDIHAVGGLRETLLDVAMSHNAECDLPMTVEEVSRVVDNVWKMTIEHRNWIGRSGDRKTEVGSFSGDADAFYLLEFLRANEGASSTFWIANGLADKFGWPLRRLVSARARLIALSYISMVKPAWTGSPAEYVWA